MITRQTIIDAYVFLREKNNSIPDATLDFIKDASLSAYDSLPDDFCVKCIHNGKQIIYPSGCTGCGSNGERRNFKLKGA